MKLHYERILHVPERFRGYRILLVSLAERPECDVIYDMQMRVIWVNTAAAPGANVACVEFPKG